MRVSKCVKVGGIDGGRMKRGREGEGERARFHLLHPQLASL